MNYYQCPNCGCSVMEGAKYCSECGSPIIDTRMVDDNLTDSDTLDDEYTDTVEDNLEDTFLGTKKKGVKRKKKKRSPIRRLIIWAIVIALAIWGKLEYDAYNYGINLHNVGYYAYTSADHLESAGILFYNVWNNSVNKIINEETDKYTREADGTGQFYTDFNDALKVLENSKEYKDERSQAEEAQNEAYELMGKLTNPPKRYEEAYRDIKSFYTDYIAFYNTVMNPNGTLADYRDKFEKTRDAFIQSSYAISMY